MAKNMAKLAQERAAAKSALKSAPKKATPKAHHDDGESLVLPALDYLDPATMSYKEWLEVGMALHAEGHDVAVWNDWSRRDPGRYTPRQIETKWRSFTEGGGIAGGTVVEMAKQRGWRPPERERKKAGGKKAGKQSTGGNRARDGDGEDGEGFRLLCDVRPVMAHNPPPKPPDAIEGVVCVGCKLLVVAPGKAGKTHCFIQLAAAFAIGGEWLGSKCKQMRVLYIDFEMSKGADDRRFHHAAEAMPTKAFLDADKIKDAIEENIDIQYLRGKEHVKLQEDLGKEIERFCSLKKAEGKPYGAIILDPLYKTFQGEENAAGEVAEFMDCITRLTVSTGCLVAVAHHTGKGGGHAQGKGDMGRGSSVFTGDPDAVIELRELPFAKKGATPLDGGRAFRVDFTLREHYREPIGAVFTHPLWSHEDWVLEQYTETGKEAKAEDGLADAKKKVAMWEVTAKTVALIHANGGEPMKAADILPHLQGVKSAKGGELTDRSLGTILKASPMLEGAKRKGEGNAYFYGLKEPQSPVEEGSEDDDGGQTEMAVEEGDDA